MNKTLSTILIVLAFLALAGGIFLFGTMYARANALGPGTTLAPGASIGVFGYGRNNNNAYGPGMAGGRGNFGMMGGQRGYGMTLAPGAGAGANGYGQNNVINSNVIPLTVDQAKQAAGKYIQSLDVQGLEIGEVMIFNNNAYVAIKESDTGLGAFELLVDPTTQTASPEYGSNMMWNLKYGGLNHSEMAGGRGMMGTWNNQSTSPAKVSTDMPITKDQAIKSAQAYLDQAQPGVIAANDPVQFYGYYTLDYSKDGKVISMLSVNGYNGQIFLHTWHGTFVEESK
jgi:hypothetical protein